MSIFVILVSAQGPNSSLDQGLTTKPNKSTVVGVCGGEKQIYRDYLHLSRDEWIYLELTHIWIDMEIGDEWEVDNMSFGIGDWGLRLDNKSLLVS